MLTIAELARAAERVFPTHARVERYYPAAAAEEARGILGRCLDRGEGPALLIGAPGTGKSMLLEVLADDLGKTRPVVCLTSAQLCTRRALLQSILFELGQSYRNRDEGDLRLTLMDYLSGDDVRNTGLLLLVDEAQALANHLLEELRVLSNLAHQGVPTVRLLLAGSQSLEETFTDPAVGAFNQRVVARCYLAPLNHYDTAQFVRGHLAAAGASPDEVFTGEALDAVHRATDGIARLVNQVCDRALLIAAGHGQMQVTKEIVEGAWADLQQLPTPWNLPEAPSERDSNPDESEQVIEFGPLSDDLVEVESEPATAACTEPAPARMYEPDPDENEAYCNDTPAEPLVAVEQQDPVPQQESLLPEPTTQTTTDDLFGGDFEEEIVIDDFASLEQAIPPDRPRVTSSSDADLGQLLHEVTGTTQTILATAPSVEIEQVPDDELLADPFGGLSVIDHADEDVPLDATELDEEGDELLGEIASMATEAGEAATVELQPSDGDGNAVHTEDIDILVIDDEMSTSTDTAAAHRADYRQLFKTLRNS